MGDREKNDFVHGIMPQGSPGESAVSIIADFLDKSCELPGYHMWDPRFTRKTIDMFKQSELPLMERLELVPLNWRGHSVLMQVMAVDDPCKLANHVYVSISRHSK